MIKKFKYGFDNTMSKGLMPLIGLLTIFTLVFIVAITFFVSFFRLFPSHEDLTWGEVAWRSLLRTLDPGTMAGDDGLGFRAAMLLVTLFGVILVASLIGIISNSLSYRIEKLRKGKSAVLERNHTVILGWNSKAIQIISEITIANESLRKPSIVILAEKDKLEIEDEIHQRIKHTRNTRLVVRSGDPMSKIDLKIVAIQDARSIVILSPDGSDDADSFSIKTALALRNLADAPKDSCSIVAEIRTFTNMEAAKLVGEGKVHWVLGEDLINRLIAQSCRQAGLSGAFVDILDFDGSEIYLYNSPQLLGLTYHDAGMRLKTSLAIGIYSQGKVILNPEGSYLLSAEDELIVISEDDSTINLTDPASFDSSQFADTHTIERKKESTLIVGSNSGLEMLLTELDRDLLAGSSVCVVASKVDLKDFEAKNFDLEIVSADPTSREVLESVKPQEFDHIIILASRMGGEAQAADARTLLSLLHIRALTKDVDVNIVTEILDDHNRELVETNRVDDFIVSDKLVSHAIAQLAENKDLHPVFDELFSALGPSLKIYPIERYVKLNSEMDFNTVIAAAQHLGESVVGYRSKLLRSETSELHGVRLNPARTQKMKFIEGDALIVLA
jgi:ion channel POLLUX/CASTOR